MPTVFVLLHVGMSAQSVAPQGKLYQQRDSIMAVLDAIQGTIPDSEFYREGGTYAETQKWFSNWEPRLAPHGDFDIYDQVLKGYMDAKFHNGSTFKSNNDQMAGVRTQKEKEQYVGYRPDKEPDRL